MPQELSEPHPPADVRTIEARRFLRHRPIAVDVVSDGAARASAAQRRKKGRLETIATAAFVGVLALTIPIYVSSLNGYAFRGDDWRLFQRGGSVGDYLEPYNQHLSAVPIGTYRLLLETFGLASTLPLRIVNTASLAMLVVAMFLVIRARFGAPIALIIATDMLWLHELQLTPAAFNHWLALTATIFCAWALTQKSPSLDIAIGLALTFALCSSGVGVAGAVGCIVYVSLSRTSVRRRIAVAVPTVAWAAWWLLVSGDRDRGAHLPLSDTLHYAFDGVVETFRELAAGNQVVGVVLAVLFAANLVWRLRNGPRAACLELSWTAALLFWWFGLAYSRGVFVQSFGSAGLSRYDLIGAGFIILAVQPIHLANGVARRLPSRTQVLAVAIGASAFLICANNDGILSQAHLLEQGSNKVRQQLVAANLGPEVVPDGAVLALGALALNPNAGVYRALAARHGRPAGTGTSTPDASIVALGPIRLQPTRRSPDLRCLSLGDGRLPHSPSTTVLRAADTDVVVKLRRFGTEWIPIGTIRAGSAAALTLPGLESPVPWMVEAPGACRERARVTQIACAAAPSGTTEPAAIAVPSEVGKNVYAAALDLKGRQLVFGVASVRSPTLAKGLVISQIPAAGAKVRAGTCIRLNVSTGR